MDGQYDRWLQNKRRERQSELLNISTNGNQFTSVERRTSVLSRVFNPPNNNNLINNSNPQANNNLPIQAESEQSEEIRNLSEIDIELNNLLQSQTVSNILNSQTFRSSLEERLQSSLSRLNNAVSVRNPTSQSSQPPTISATVNIQDVIDPNNDPELTALLNYQVVSNMLQSVFRTHLENTLWTRYVLRNQNVPNSIDVRSNDGSSFNRIRDHSAAENIQQSNLLHSMKNEIAEIRSMMRIMLQSQIETQRFMRQEMASVFSSVTKDTDLRNAEIINACVICLNCQSDTIMYRCGHLCLCYPCSMQIRITANGGPILCPVCRSDVQEILRVFTSQAN